MSAETETTADPEFRGSLARAPRFRHQWRLARDPSGCLARLVHEYGDFVQCRGLVDFYLINHPALVRQVLHESNRNFDKGSLIYDRFRRVFGKSLVTAEGGEWKRRRQLTRPSFGPTAIRGFFEVMLEGAEATLRRFSEAERSGRVLRMDAEMDRVTLEIAGRSFFSNGFDGAVARIGRWTTAINRYSAKPPLPVVSEPWFPTLTNLRLRRALEEYRRFVGGLVRERAASASMGDLMDVLLESMGKGNGGPTDGEGLAEELLGLIVAGHESTSAALTWIWYELHRHPEVERRMLEEIDAVTGGGPLDFERVGELRFTAMVIQEVMRLHPPFWFENRNTVADVVLGGELIPRGSMIVFSRHALQRHPGFWRDPDCFRPERFDPDRPENPVGSCAHVPFGSGPRVCIGRHFALMEITVVVATVLARFRVAVDASHREGTRARLSMTLRHGLPVRIVRREGTPAAD